MCTRYKYYILRMDVESKLVKFTSIKSRMLIVGSIPLLSVGREVCSKSPKNGANTIFLEGEKT